VIGPVGTRVELSLVEFDVLWEDLRLGDVPFPIEVRRHGATLGERARTKASVYVELRGRGLIQGDRPAVQIEDALHVLARPRVRVDLLALLEDEQPVKALVVARGARALLAVQRELALELCVVHDTAMVNAIVEMLPPCQPGTGRSVCVSAASIDPGHPDMALIDRIVRRPLLRMGQFGMTVRDERGKLRRLPGIAWFDTDQGRYTSTVIRGRDGLDWTTVSPADNSRLVHRINETLAQRPTSA
jgi:hypothetical protein